MPYQAVSGSGFGLPWHLLRRQKITFLNEPTTYLDIPHQLEVLELLQKLNMEQGRTIVMVLHDLNRAARFADYMIALKDGENCECRELRGSHDS